MSTPQNNLDALKRRLLPITRNNVTPAIDGAQATKSFKFKSSTGLTRSSSTPSTSKRLANSIPSVSKLSALECNSPVYDSSGHFSMGADSSIECPSVGEIIQPSVSFSSVIPAKRLSSPNPKSSVKRSKMVSPECKPDTTSIPSSSSFEGSNGAGADEADHGDSSLLRSSMPEEMLQSDLKYYQKFSYEKLQAMLTNNMSRQLCFLDERIKIKEGKEDCDEAMLKQFIEIIGRRNAVIRKVMGLKSTLSTLSAGLDRAQGLNGLDPVNTDRSPSTSESVLIPASSFKATSFVATNNILTDTTAPSHNIPESHESIKTAVSIDVNDDDALWAQVDDVTTDSFSIAGNMPSPSFKPLQSISNTLEHRQLQKPSGSGSDMKENSVDHAEASYFNEVDRVLHDVFRLDSFRPNQLEAINATLAGKDVFVLMPTGGGKSLCYQVPAVCETGVTRGVTVVVCPLIALMIDQVRHLLNRGIDVVLFNSDQDEEDSREAQARFSYGGSKPKLLYVTPEKLHKSGSMRFILARLYREGQLARFVIDEAHCVSTWGRDFREAYQDLDRLRQEYPTTPIMALTATANEQVMTDVIGRLGIKGCTLLRQSFNRPNLYYDVRPKRKNVLEDISNFIKAHHQGQTGIIYCLGRKTCEEVAERLRSKYDLRAKHYHAHMSVEDKVRAQTAWQTGECQVIVATIAFGMGIDKPDVRYVIHHTLPKSLDGYYQETGRAGRDGKPAACVLFYQYADTKALFRMVQDGEKTAEERKRQEDDIRAVVQYCQNVNDCRRAQVLSYFGQSFDKKDCKKRCNNCADGAEYVQEDLTEMAIKAIRLVKDLVGRDQHVTKLHCLDVFRGANIKPIRDKGHDRLDLFGAGSNLSREQVERLFDHLLNSEAFRQITVANKSGWNSLYMQLGSTANEFLNGGRQLSLTSKVTKQEGGGSNQSATTKRTGRKTGTVASSNRSSMEDPFSDTDLHHTMASIDTDDIYDFGSPPPAPKRRATIQSSRQLEGKSIGTTADGEDASQRCYHDLLKLRNELSAENFFEDNALQLISAILPQDQASMRALLCDNFSENSIDKIDKLYGAKVLEVCNRYRMSASASALERQKLLRSKSKLDPSELHAQFDFQAVKPVSSRTSFKTSSATRKATSKSTITIKNGIRPMPL